MTIFLNESKTLSKRCKIIFVDSSQDIPWNMVFARGIARGRSPRAKTIFHGMSLLSSTYCYNIVFALHYKVVQNLAAAVKFVHSIIKTLICCGDRWLYKIVHKLPFNSVQTTAWVPIKTSCSSPDKRAKWQSQAQGWIPVVPSVRGGTEGWIGIMVAGPDNDSGGVCRFNELWIEMDSMETSEISFSSLGSKTKPCYVLRAVRT